MEVPLLTKKFNFLFLKVLEKVYKGKKSQALISLEKMPSIPIYYRVYPGNSARWFPSIASLIFVKPEIYEQWKENESSIKFEDVLFDPSDPVKFLWTDFSGKKGYIDQGQVHRTMVSSM